LTTYGFRDPVVPGIKGFKLGYSLEIDPKVNTPLVQGIHNIKNRKSQRYR
jgi:hypothetical protein